MLSGPAARPFFNFLIADFISWIVGASTGMLESDDAPAVARSRSMILKTSSF